MPRGDNSKKTTLEQVIVALKKTDGVMLPAAKLLGISKQAVTIRVKRNSELRKLCKQLQRDKRNRRITKRHFWLKHFFDQSNPKTFMSRAGSARAAGYNCTKDQAFQCVGSNNFHFWKDKIAEWLDEKGLDENTLKTKMVQLLNAKETKFFAFQGKVIDREDIEALEIQRKTLKMAVSLRGMNVPEVHKHEVDGLAELLAQVSGKTRGLPNETQEKIR